MKKLFTNYNFEFDKNEKRLLTTFIKQNLKQMEGDSRFYSETRSFSSILEKLNSGEETIKLTKEERTKLKFSVEQNVKHLRKELDKAGFIKKFLYRSMLKQYESILANHFKDGK